MEIFFRYFYKTFFLLFIFVYLVFYLALGYRIQDGELVKKDVVIEIISWKGNFKVYKIGEVVIDGNLSNLGKISIYDIDKGCYNILIDNLHMSKFCFNGNKFYQFVSVKVVGIDKVNYLSDNIKIFEKSNLKYENNCINNNLCFSSNIIGVFEIFENDLRFIQTEEELYVCSKISLICNRLMDNFSNKILIGRNDNGIYFADFNQNIYLIKLK